MRKSSFIVVILSLILMIIGILLVINFPKYHILIEIGILLVCLIISYVFGEYNRCRSCGKKPRRIFLRHCPYCGEKFDKN